MPNPKLETYKNKATNTVYDLTDADAQSKLTAILDGTDIDSFGDVESALADKADVSDLDDYVQKSATAGLLKNDGTVDTTTYLSSVPFGTTGDVGGFTYDANDFEISVPSNNKLSILRGLIAPNVEKVPSAGDVYDAIQDVYKANGVLGAKNLLPVTLSDVKARNTGGTWSGDAYTFRDVTYTFEVDGGYITKVSTSGTATGGTSYLVLNYDYVFKAGMSYTISGCGKYGQEVWVGLYITATSQYDDASSKDGVDMSFGFDVDTTRQVRIRIGSGIVADNFEFYHMIRLATDTDPTHAPYAMTNRELTDNKFDIRKALSSSNNINDVKETGIYAIETQPINAPTGFQYGTLIVQKNNDTDLRQMFIKGGNSPFIAVRSYGGQTPQWYSWFKFEGTIIS